MAQEWDQRLTEPAPAHPHYRPASERLVTLDALRGFALLGILMPNIIAFSWPMAAMTDPAVMGDTPANRVFHDAISTVFLGKFMFMFAMMFGAGVVLFDRKTAPRDGSRPRLTDGVWLWHRRCAVLLGVGLVHAYLFWYGDILVWYAAAGLTLLWWIRKLPAALQIWGGLGVYVCGSLLLVGVSALGLWALSSGKVEASELMGGDPSTEIAGYLGSWSDAFKARFGQTLMMHLFLGPVYLPALWGIMALGMGLARAGVLTGERSTRFHATLGIALVAAGGLATYAAYHWVHTVTDHPGFLWQALAQLVGVPLAIGYSQVVVALARTRFMAPVTRAFANVGRMALSNYLLHTLICTTVMYGYGFGRFASIAFPDLFALVVGVWLANFVFSALWLRYFAYGPAEWLWRQATYLGLKTTDGPRPAGVDA